MTTQCYIVEINSDNESMFEALDEYGFDYWTGACWGCVGYMEIYIDCYPHEIPDLENIMKWYV